MQENEVLFPCHKSLFQTVSTLKNKPNNILELAEDFINNLTNESKDKFVNAVLEFINYIPPEKYEVVLSKFIDDNELWWYKQRPNIAEW